MTKNFKCLRCGHCCVGVGRTFWRHGDFSRWPELEKLAARTPSKDEGLPCQMLQMEDGVAECKIETLYGHEAKPEECRNFPLRNNACLHRRKLYRGQGVCLQEDG